MTDYEYSYQNDYPSGVDYNYVMEPTAYEHVYLYSENVNLVLQFFTIFINFFHLSILIQKEVRSSSIYILMTGICVSDILNFSISVYLEGVNRKWYYQIFEFSNLDCLREDYQLVNFGYEILRMLLNSTRPITVCLAISMALFRVLTLMFPLDSWTLNLAKIKLALCQILAITVIWLLYYGWNFLFITRLWYPDNLCDDLEFREASRNVTVFVMAIPIDIYELSVIRDGWEYWVRIVPTVFYPVLSGKLIWKLREIRTKRRRASDIIQREKSDNLTYLILFMTLSFMLSEGIDGIRSFLLLDAFYWGQEYPGLRKILLSSEYIITSLRCFNSISHLFVCYSMSSQYRGTVVRMFCMVSGSKKSLAVKVIPVRSSSSRKLRTKTFNNYELY